MTVKGKVDMATFVRNLGGAYTPTSAEAAAKLAGQGHAVSAGASAQTGAAPRYLEAGEGSHGGRQLVWDAAKNCYAFVSAGTDLFTGAGPRPRLTPEQEARLLLDSSAPIKPFMQGVRPWTQLGYSPFANAEGVLMAQGLDPRTVHHAFRPGADGRILNPDGGRAMLHNAMAAVEDWRSYTSVALRYLGPAGVIDARQSLLRRLDADSARLHAQAKTAEDYREMLFLCDWADFLCMDQYWEQKKFGTMRYWRDRMRGVFTKYQELRQREDAPVQVIFGDFHRAMELRHYRAAQMIVQLTSDWAGHTDVMYRAQQAHYALAGLARTYDAYAYWGPRAATYQLSSMAPWLRNQKEYDTLSTTLAMYRRDAVASRSGFASAGIYELGKVLEHWERLYDFASRGAVGLQVVSGTRWTDALQATQGADAAFRQAIRVMAEVKPNRSLQGGAGDAFHPLAQLVAVGNALSHHRKLRPGHVLRGAYIEGMRGVELRPGDRDMFSRDVMVPMLKVVRAMAERTGEPDMALLTGMLHRIAEVEQSADFPDGVNGHVLGRMFDGARLVAGDVLRAGERVGLKVDSE